MKISCLAFVVAAMMALPPLQTADAAKGKKAAKGKPLRVTVHPGKRRGGYSYSKTDSISAKDIRRLTNPKRQSLGGPFDSDFFFEAPSGPFGGYTPYMQ